MQNPLMYVVVPCHRPSQLQWVFDRYDQQTYGNRKLCIVENGDAVGACKRLGFTPDLVVTSRPHVSHARNEGMYAIRDLGIDCWLSMWDDDDWYGSEYLEEMASLAASDKANVYGKQRHFVAFPDHGMYLFNEVNQNKYTDSVHGPTLVFRPEEGIVFKVQREAEEIRWCYEMSRLGARIWSASIKHLLYLRYDQGHEHAWKAPSGTVVSASRKNDFFYWLGDVDLDVVTGSVDWKTRVMAQEGARVPPPFTWKGDVVKMPVLPVPGETERKPQWSHVSVARM